MGTTRGSTGSLGGGFTVGVNIRCMVSAMGGRAARATGATAVGVGTAGGAFLGNRKLPRSVPQANSGFLTVGCGAIGCVAPVGSGGGAATGWGARTGSTGAGTLCQMYWVGL